jgi:hypothetical protein
MTLKQAILASGEPRRDGIKRTVIRRINAGGLLVSTEYNVRLIKNGKALDPVLKAGNTIEVGN